MASERSILVRLAKIVVWQRLFDSPAGGIEVFENQGTARSARAGSGVAWHGWPRKRGRPKAKWRGSQFLTEVGWRAFSHHLLFHFFPHTPAEPLRVDFREFPWRKNAAWLKAWQRGRTGYPIVDAGMCEVDATDWMHNRVRMTVASFRVKDLLLSWEQGAAWF